ncbi:aldo/keto reductase [Apiospora marii]|uniref:Aldo/keto reductase n=1 Tax=Apiospora marii TaxID=335849 RepID=A0ABR1RYF7_9PEZI
MGSIVNGHILKNGIKPEEYHTQHRPVFESKSVPAALAQSIAATKVEYRRVGSSGLIVSNPILGTLGLGDSRWMNWAMDEEEARKILYAAYTRGINTWDTANAYSNGQTEAIIGRVIKDFNIPRRKLVLMTKVGRILADTEHGDSSDFVAFLDESVQKSKDYVNQYGKSSSPTFSPSRSPVKHEGGLSRMAILSAVDQSLERLQSTYIDVLHIHRWDPDTPIEETMGTLHGLVASGKCVAELRGWTKIVAMQHHYNLLYREEEREMVKFCQRTGVGMLSWSPLAEGYLARPLEMADRTARSARFGHGSSDADREIIARVQQVARDHGAVMSQVALAWLGRRVCAAIVGVNSVQRMDEVLRAREVVLTDEEDAWLGEPYLPKAIQGHS